MSEVAPQKSKMNQSSHRDTAVAAKILVTISDPAGSFDQGRGLICAPDREEGRPAAFRRLKNIPDTQVTAEVREVQQEE